MKIADKNKAKIEEHEDMFFTGRDLRAFRNASLFWLLQIALIILLAIALFEQS